MIRPKENKINQSKTKQKINLPPAKKETTQIPVLEPPTHLDVFTKVVDLSVDASTGQVVVDPAQQDLFRRQADEVFNRLPIHQQVDQSWVMRQVDVTQQTNLLKNRDHWCSAPSQPHWS